MRTILHCVVLVAAMAVVDAQIARSDTVVEFVFDLGVLGSNSTVQVQLFDRQAPLTVANFLRYVTNHEYDGTVVHNKIQDVLFEGGGYRMVAGQLELVPNHGVFGNNEFDLSRPNVAGTIAMAKDGDPNSAMSEWFFNIKDNSGTFNDQNGGFTAFGRVIGNGMSVANTINTLGSMPGMPEYASVPIVWLPSGAPYVLVLTSLTALPTPTNFVWQGGAGGGPATWDSVLNWGTNTSVPDAAGARVTLGAAGAASTVELNMFDRMVGAITFNADTSTTIQSGQYWTGPTTATAHFATCNLILDNAGGAANISVAGTHKILSPLVLGSSVAIDTSSGATLEISSAISQTAVGKGLSKSGPGTLILSGTNTYTGATAVYGGAMYLVQGGSMGATAVGVSGNATYGLRQLAGGTVNAGSDLSVDENAILDLWDGQFNTMRFTGSGIATGLSGESTVRMDLGSILGKACSDRIDFGGALSARFSLAFQSTSDTLTTGVHAYTLMTGAGLTADAFSAPSTLLVGTTTYGLSLDTDGSNLWLNVTGGSGMKYANTWVPGSGTWNSTSTSWAATSASPADSRQGDGRLLFEGTDPGVTVSGLVTVKAGMTFNSPYNLSAGTGAEINLAGGVGANVIAVTTAGHTTTIQAPLSGSNGLTKSGAGTLALNGANTYSGVTTVSGGALELGTAAVQNVIGTYVPGTAASLSGGQGANITAGKLVIKYGDTSPEPGIANSLKAAYAAGFAAGGGRQFSSSTAYANQRALGWMDNLTTKSVTVMYTLYGDATLDGVVNFDDLSKVLTNYNSSSQNWATGDATYDGVVNFDDLSKVLTAYNTGLGAGETGSGLSGFDSTGGFTVVPEPSSVVLLIAGFVGLLAYGGKEKRTRAKIR